LKINQESAGDPPDQGLTVEVGVVHVPDVGGHLVHDPGLEENLVPVQSQDLGVKVGMTRAGPRVALKADLRVVLRASQSPDLAPDPKV